MVSEKRNTGRRNGRYDTWRSLGGKLTLFPVEINENRTIHQGSPHTLASLCCNNSVSIDLWPTSFIPSAFEKRSKIHRSD